MRLDPNLQLSLGGTWWMDGNPLTQEQLVSFAGAEGNGPYPTIVKNPSSGQRRWTWSTSFFARAIVFYYSLTSSVDTPHDFHFENSSYADIAPVAAVFGDNAFGFRRIGGVGTDEWDRVDTYILRRIIYGNGTAHPVFWPKFLQWYKSVWPDGQILVYSSDSDCMRRCQYFALCIFCDMIC